MQTLKPNLQIDETTSLNTKISQLIHALRKVRCLLVLDNVDSILSSNGDNSVATSKPDPLLQIQYIPGYEGYGELIKRIGESQHQSCLLITGREKPPVITEIEGEKLPVHSLKLTSLSKTESLGILQVKGIDELDHIGSHILIDSYAGNLLFLKLVATTIQDLFAGSIDQFLEQGTLVFGNIRRILDQQLNRLSELENILCIG